MDPKQLLALYRAMVTARQIDKLELELNSRGEAFFHVSGAGHEGTADSGFICFTRKTGCSAIIATRP